MNQSHRGSSRRHPKGAPPPAARTLIELSIKRAGGSQPQTQIPYTADKLHRYSIVSSGGWEGNRDDTRVRLSHNVRAHTAALAAVALCYCAPSRQTVQRFKHQSSASRDSTTSMPPRSPSGRYVPAGSPLPEEPSRMVSVEYPDLSGEAHEMRKIKIVFRACHGAHSPPAH